MSDLRHYLAATAVACFGATAPTGLATLVLAAASLSGALLATEQCAAAAEFSLASEVGGPGAFVDAQVSLDGEGDDVHRVVVEVHWPAGFSAPQYNSRPDCRFQSGDAGFEYASFVPNGCDPASTCSGFVASTASAEPLPSGALFSCRIRVADSAAPVTYRLTFAGQLAAFGLNGLELPVTGTDGLLAVFPGAVASTGYVVASAGDEASVDIRLTSNVPIASVEHHLMLPPQARLLAAGEDGAACSVGAGIDSDCVNFLPLPPGCTPGTDCTGMRAVIVGACLGQAIPSGTVLYSCEVEVDLAAEEGQYPLQSITGGASNPSGGPVDLSGSDGVLIVDEAAFVKVFAGNAAARPGETASMLASFSTNIDVETVGHRLLFDPEARIAADAGGRPRCTSLASGTESRLDFIPDGCAAGVDCTGIESVVSASGAQPLPASLLLYRCELEVAADAAPGSYALRIENLTASGPDSPNLPGADPLDGVVDVRDTFPATLVVGSVTGQPGARPTIEVTLERTTDVAGTQNDILYSPPVRIAATSHGAPNCRTNPDISHQGTAFAFLPTGCQPESTCVGIRAVVLALNNVDPLPALLYTCEIAIAEDAAPGTYPLDVFNVGASSPNGIVVASTGVSGAVEVVLPTATITATPLATTPSATSTPLATATARATSTPARLALGDDGSCAIVPTGGGLWLLAPPLPLAWLRRRRSHV